MLSERRGYESRSCWPPPRSLSRSLPLSPLQPLLSPFASHTSGAARAGRGWREKERVPGSQRTHGCHTPMLFLPPSEQRRQGAERPFRTSLLPPSLAISPPAHASSLADTAAAGGVVVAVPMALSLSLSGGEAKWLLGRRHADRGMAGTREGRGRRREGKEGYAKVRRTRGRNFPSFSSPLLPSPFPLSSLPRRGRGVCVHASVRQ